MLALNSVTESLKDEAYKSFFNDLRIGAMVGNELNERSNFYLEFSIDSHTSNVDLFHPVVVTDAHLWMVDSADLKETPWCRFQQLDSDGRAVKWYDVVNAKYAETYFNNVSDYYYSILSGHGASPMLSPY